MFLKISSTCAEKFKNVFKGDVTNSYMKKAILDIKLWTKENDVRIVDLHYTINESDVNTVKALLETLEEKRKKGD